MRSLIILEVEHGETTDPLVDFIYSADAAARLEGWKLTNYAVRVDVPECFVIDSGSTTKEN